MEKMILLTSVKGVVDAFRRDEANILKAVCSSGFV